MIIIVFICIHIIIVAIALSRYWISSALIRFQKLLQIILYNNYFCPHIKEMVIINFV